mgnify:FL=1
MTTERDSSGPPLPRPIPDEPWPERLAAWRDQIGAWRQRPPSPAGETDNQRPGRSRVAVIALVTAAALGGVVLAWVALDHRPGAPPVETLIPTLEPVDLEPPTARGATAPMNQSIVVHVAGAVHQPGLVELIDGARVADAIQGAGGATDDADLDRVNLATRLADEHRVVVPVVGEPIPEPVISGADTADSQRPLIDINTAEPAELESLPGVGPATAAAIVAHREEHGSFTEVAGLLAVPGIGPAKLDRLRPQATVNR